MSALKLLSDLDFQHKINKFKNTPLHAIPRASFNDRTSNGLTRCIIRWLELHNNYAVRINTMGRQLAATTVIDVIGRAHVTPGKWIPGTTRRGTADIHASINGRHVSIEVKVGRDKMSDEQHDTQQMVEESGGLYVVATSFEQFLDWYFGLLGSSP
jgi:hypothetical protein